jgi:DNA-directed RNA polymerase specialized sigma24 family protein
MERLPEAMREAVDLVYARSMTIAAAARSVGESEETLKKRVQRARKALAECLGINPSAEVSS